MFWFGPPSLIFFEICQMVICPVRRTYNHVSIFLFSSTKKAFKLPSRVIFAIAEFSYLFRTSQLTEKLQFLSRICQMVKNTISGTCHHEANFPRVNSFSNIFFKTSIETL